MNYSIDKQGDTTNITLQGQLTFEAQAQFRQLIKDLEGSWGSQNVIDLMNVDFIDSAGLGLLLRVRAVAESSSQNLALRVPEDGQVRKMMNVARFDQMITLI